MAIASSLIMHSCDCGFSSNNSVDFPYYEGNDLGVTYRTDKTIFRLWAPKAQQVVLRLYDNGESGEPIETVSLKPDRDGTWVVTLKGDWKNKYYTLQAQNDGKWSNEVPDPYARAVGVNGNRGMVVDLPSTNPEGWQDDRRPTLDHYADIIIWEIHVRDFSIHPSSGSKYPGKYLAFTESGSQSSEGEKTLVDHLVELGITHVHLLPVFDFHTVDETRLDQPQFNWGYDPQNFNVPEGSYSTNPYDGNVRIREFKQMVKALHSVGIRVIMDVVYNHMYNAAASNFEQLVPGYFFRSNDDGTLANGSGCGNETSSEKPMMRKFMIESVTYWASEYHIDGFRFDLMGLHDIETMNQIRQALDEIDPTIYIYGEGWTAGESPLPVEKRALKAHVAKLDRIAVFSDDIRDGIRGPWWDDKGAGFMAGKKGLEESIKFGVVAATPHSQIDYTKVNYSKAPYANNPQQTITYVTCHDNPCLWDKIVSTCTNCTKAQMLELQKFANAVVLTSQGVAFLHAGEELVRTKLGHHNTYNLPDSVNQLNWGNKAMYRPVFEYYQKLIQLRKSHPAFRMIDTLQIQKHLRFFQIDKPLLVGYQLSDNANGDPWKDILVFYNASSKAAEVKLPAGEWEIVATKDNIEEKGFTAMGLGKSQIGKAMVPSRSVMILVDKSSI